MTDTNAGRSMQGVAAPETHGVFGCVSGARAPSYQLQGVWVVCSSMRLTPCGGCEAARGAYHAPQCTGDSPYSYSVPSNERGSSSRVAFSDYYCSFVMFYVRLTVSFPVFCTRIESRALLSVSRRWILLEEAQLALGTENL